MKSVLILSGGVDSTTLLHYLVSRGDQVLALSVNYGQRHKREIECAKWQCKKLKVSHQIADISSLRQLLKRNSLTDKSVSIPHGHYTEKSMKQTVVPNRNMLMLSIAAAYAISEKADVIAYGAHAGDHAIYPDCRKEFVDAMKKAIVLADWHRVKLECPFVRKAKADIVRLGLKMGVNFSQTHSCYEGKKIACGRCGTCVERLEAFHLAGGKDPLVYRDREFWKSQV